MEQEYDIVLLGGGTGGYVAAIRAAQNQLKVAIVEQVAIGGTCLHTGCIPTKTLLKSAERFEQAKNLASYGIETSTPNLRLSKVMERKEAVIQQLSLGVQQLIKKYNIPIFTGKGTILGPSIFSPLPGTIAVELAEGESELLVTKQVIIATGAEPASLPYTENLSYVHNSTTLLTITTLPEKIVIVGGGVIGIEWASIFTSFGKQVTIIEAGPTILPTEDEEISRFMLKCLKKKGVLIHTNARALPEKWTLEGLVYWQDAKGNVHSTETDCVLVAVGRNPKSAEIGLQNTAIEVDDAGYIKVNEFGQTEETHIYAIGDVVGGKQLAHVAANEGIQAVNHILGREPLITKPFIPQAIYSFPEIASIGLTELEAHQSYEKVRVAKFPFSAIGKAIINGDTDGFVKMIYDEITEDLIGVHIIGAQATELISEYSTAFALNATAEELGAVIRPHPSVAEIIGETSLAIIGQPLHI